MKWFKSLSIRKKLILIILSVTIVIVTLLGVARMAWDTHQIRASLAQELSSLIQLLGDRSSAALAFDDPRLAKENLTALHTMSYIVQACLYREDGTVLAHYRRDTATSDTNCIPINRVKLINKTFEVDRLHIATEVRQDSLSLGWIYLGSDLSLISARLQNQFVFTSIALLVAIVTAGLLAQWLQRLISGPIEEITTVAREIEEKGAHNLRVKIHSLDEIGQLARTFNNMLDALDSQNQQLRRNQKMDALGKLTGGIAHDYNNMLGIILGYAELLEDLLVDQPKLANYAYEIRHAGERGTKLTKRLLAFSKQKHADAQTTQINLLLNDGQQMLEKTLTARIKLKFELSNELWPVHIDSSDLEDAIINLCINAMHAITQTGKITIQTKNISINESDALRLQVVAGDYVLLNIIDSGSGMSREITEKIFDPFFSTKGDKGTGLGLSQVYGFVERSAGAIKVYSVLGQGTRFSLYFPRCTESISTKESFTPMLQHLQGSETILVVDDEAAMVNLAKDILSTSGYKILTASNGKQALSVIKENAVDLVLTDVIMPVMDGFQLISVLQKKYPRTKIQMVSGFSDDRNKSMKDGILQQKMLHKPYTSKVLLERVRTVLNEKIVTIPDENYLLGRRILIMDDDDDVRELFKISLEKLGCDVLLAGDGNEAISLYRENRKDKVKIDVMILDLSIPNGLGGNETARKMRLLDQDIKLIVSSGYVEGPEMTSYKKYGFNAAIEKNFNRENIKRVLINVLSDKK